MKVHHVGDAGLTIRLTWKQVGKLHTFLQFFRLNRGEQFTRGEDVFATQLDNVILQETDRFRKEKRGGDHPFGTVYARAIKRS